MSESTTRFWLLRHGRPVGGECFRGRTDLALSDTGARAMATALERLPEIDRVISSPLRRCQSFADQWSEQRGLGLEIAEALIELDFGRWDGRPSAEVWAEEPERLQQFWSAPYDYGPPEGEAVADFEARILSAMFGWLHAYSGERLLLISHGGVMRALLKWVFNLPEQSLTHLQALELGYASLIELEVFTDSDGRHWPRLIALHPAPQEK